MIRGILLELNNRDPFILKKLLEPIDLSDKWVYVQDWEVYFDNLSEAFLKKEIYEGDELKALIEKPHSVIFLNLSVFPSKDAIRHNKDYDEYKSSACMLTLLCTDSGFFEIYIKDSNEFSKVYEACKHIDVLRLEYITDENDARYTFEIL